MNENLHESITSNERLRCMRTGILGSYAMHDDDWEERYRIEAAHALTGDAPLRERGKQQQIFEARRAAFEARHKRPIATPSRAAV